MHPKNVNYPEIKIQIKNPDSNQNQNKTLDTCENFLKKKLDFVIGAKIDSISLSKISKDIIKPINRFIKEKTREEYEKNLGNYDYIQYLPYYKLSISTIDSKLIIKNELIISKNQYYHIERNVIDEIFKKVFTQLDYQPF